MQNTLRAQRHNPTTLHPRRPAATVPRCWAPPSPLLGRLLFLALLGLALAVAAGANEPPQTALQYLYTEVDQPASIWLDYSDPDGPVPFEVTIVSPPAHGELVLAPDGDPDHPRHHEYTPEAGFSGFDGFEWQVSDGFGNLSAVTEVKILVNGKPVAFPQDALVTVDTPLAVELAWEDDGHPPLPPEVTIKQDPEHGTVNETEPGVFLYAPDPGYVGSDQFQWIVDDGMARSNWGKVTISVEEAPALAVMPSVVNFVETRGTPVATSQLEVSNPGGGLLDWSVAGGHPQIGLTPSAGTLGAGEAETVTVEIPMEAAPPGSYSTSLTVSATGFDPVGVPLTLTVDELPGKNIGAEDMVEIRLIENGTGAEGGTVDFVNGPGELPTLEVWLLPEVEEGRLYLTAPEDLSGIAYLQFDLEAPVGTRVQPILDESLGEGEHWSVDPFHVYAEGVERYHVPMEDFRYDYSGEPRPIDPSRTAELQLKLAIPVAGQVGYPGDGERTLRLTDLRLTERSVDISAALAAGPAEVHLDAGVAEGALPRPWEGLTGFVDRQDFLVDLGLSRTRESALSINDWEANRDMIRGVGDYDFTRIDATYRRFLPEVEHMPWIPTIPYFLWQVQDPDILAEGGQVDRPKYAFMPPSDYPAWQEVVADFVRHHLDTGVNVKAFSILNEPDAAAFWQGTEAEAHEFFARTAEAVKSVDPDLPVVGPSHGGLPDPQALADFIDHCAAHDVPLDYLSFHGYFGSRHAAGTFEQAARLARELLAAHGDRFADTGLMVNEWAHSLREGFESRNQGPIAAAAVASAFLGMVEGGYDAALWFSLNAAAPDPYFGSGLFDFDAVSARPTLYAFDLFNRLGAERVRSSVAAPAAGVESLAAIDPASGVVRLLVWWTAGGNGREVGSRQVVVDFTLPEGGTWDWERLVIDDEHGDLEPGVGHLPLEPVGAGTVEGAAGELSFELPLYGVSMVTFTPLG